jgi:hypothetical protein
MQKRHFNALASNLRHVRPDAANDNSATALCGWTQAVNAVADACRQFNPNFDRARFLAACGAE